VADQLIEISLRVDTVRPFAVESMLSMLLTDTLILGQARQTVSEVRTDRVYVYGPSVACDVCALCSHHSVNIAALG
jgi:hypothetical protein